MKAKGTFGGWERIELAEGLATLWPKFLSGLSDETRQDAMKALTDILGNRHCAYDEITRRAYCFQRLGTDFYYQFWDSVESREIAKKLFAAFPEGRLPFDLKTADRIYQDAVTH
jgi:hypothetical protein